MTVFGPPIPDINDAIVTGNRRKFVSALLIIDEENVVKYAQDHRIPSATHATLPQASEIRQLIQKEVDRVNKTLANVE